MNNTLNQGENAVIAVLAATGLAWSDKLRNIMAEATAKLIDNEASVEDQILELTEEFNINIEVDQIVKYSKKGRLITEPKIRPSIKENVVTLYHDGECFWFHNRQEVKFIDDLDVIVITNDDTLTSNFVSAWLNNWRIAATLEEVYNKINYIPVEQRNLTTKRKRNEDVQPTIIVNNGREPPALVNIDYKSLRDWSRKYRIFLKQGNNLHPRMALGAGALGQLRAVWKRYANEIQSPPLESEPNLEPLQWLEVALKLYSKLEGRGGAQRGINERIKMNRNNDGKLEYVQYNNIFSEILDEQPDVNQESLIKSYKEGIRHIPSLYEALEDQIADWNKSEVTYDLNDIMVWTAGQLGFLSKWSERGDVITFKNESAKGKHEHETKRFRDNSRKEPPQTSHKNKLRCTRCGKPGHKSSECRSPIDLKLCAICFKPGHQARECRSNHNHINNQLNNTTNNQSTSTITPSAQIDKGKK